MKVILVMLHLCWLTSYGWAEMVKTESAIESQSEVQSDRQRLLDLLNRQEVIIELERYGISREEAVTRINSLTDEEVRKIAEKLDKMPPGGIIREFVFILAGPFTFTFGMVCSLTIYLFKIATFWARIGETYGERMRKFEESISFCFKPARDTGRLMRDEGNQSVDELYEEDIPEKEMDESGSATVEQDCDPAMESCT